jgi:hypothetical protein
MLSAFYRHREPWKTCGVNDSIAEAKAYLTIPPTSEPEPASPPPSTGTPDQLFKGGDEVCAPSQCQATHSVANVVSASLLGASNAAPDQSHPAPVAATPEALEDLVTALTRKLVPDWSRSTGHAAYRDAKYEILPALQRAVAQGREEAGRELGVLKNRNAELVIQWNDLAKEKIDLQALCAAQTDALKGVAEWDNAESEHDRDEMVERCRKASDPSAAAPFLAKLAEATEWAKKCEVSQTAWQEKHAAELERNDSLRARLETVEKERDYLRDYVIPEHEKHGTYWHDLAQERIAEIAPLTAELRALRKDKEMLDWLEKEVWRRDNIDNEAFFSSISVSLPDAETLREAIRNARKEQA